ncbi:MAG: putative DNA-binding domain-containing protein [Proteobacteria bacterium]|nr:putative DNA-binding domain-containing protein [Pseudomonadota bacterium]
MDLRTLQTQFIAALLSTEAQSLEQLVIAPSLKQAADKIKIYRLSRFGRMTKVLSTTFPVCAALVGEQYFKQLCFHYANQYQNNDPDISFYGKNFPYFLRNYPEILAYLPDVASLEWACFMVHAHGPINMLAGDALKKVAPKKYSNLRFRLGATHTLLLSNYPILAIWQAHQGAVDNIKEINLDARGEPLLVFRRGWDLVIDTLSAEEFLLLSCFEKAMTFEQTWQTCEETFPNLPLAALFTKAVERGWVNEFYF